MNTPADNLFSDPSVQFLQKLLDDVRNGDIILPRFQRPFVWDSQRRKTLFDSVRRGIPIGSLMIWETRALTDGDTKVIPKTELGPFKLPKIPESAPRRYLLDGEQRLMTLYFALYTPEPGGSEDSEEPASAFEVLFDLEAQAFLLRSEMEEEPAPHQLPLREIFKSRGVLSFQRQLDRAVREHDARKGLSAESTDKRLETLIERSDTVAEAIRRYKIPVTVLSTDNLELALETFMRVNSQGVTMSEAHMMNAVSWRSTFDLLEQFSRLRESLGGYPLWQETNNLADDMLLRIAKRLLEHDVYDDKVSDIAPKLRDGVVLGRIGESLRRCAGFLSARGLRNPAYIPNVMQLVILGRAFDLVPEPAPASLDGLEQWLFFTSYTEVFSRMVRGDVYQALEEQALALARGERPRAPARRQARRPLQRFDFRSARSRTLAWNFARRMMNYDHGDAANALAEGGSDSMVRLATATSLDSGSSSAIRVLCRPHEIDDLREAIRSGAALDEHLCEAQVLSERALAALRQRPKRDVEAFVRLREAELNELEENHFQQLREQLFAGAPSSESTEDSP